MVFYSPDSEKVFQDMRNALVFISVYADREIIHFDADESVALIKKTADEALEAAFNAQKASE